jgi:hypothetical protein
MGAVEVRLTLENLFIGEQVTELDILREFLI